MMMNTHSPSLPHPSRSFLPSGKIAKFIFLLLFTAKSIHLCCVRKRKLLEIPVPEKKNLGF